MPARLPPQPKPGLSASTPCCGKTSFKLDKEITRACIGAVDVPASFSGNGKILVLGSLGRAELCSCDLTCK